MDLIVWYEKDAIIGFQLCYDKRGAEKALTWKKKGGYAHNRVEDGEGRPGKYKSTPILVTDGIFQAKSVADNFKEQSTGINSDIVKFVTKKLNEYEN
jgi:hypothetical protein